MEISAEKTKLMTNNTSGINTEIKVNRQKLETVTSFKYLGSVITDESSKPEILSRIAQTTAALTRLKPVWIYRSISVSSKIQLMCSLVTSVFLYACESWILTRIQAMEMRCYRKNEDASSWRRAKTKPNLSTKFAAKQSPTSALLITLMA